jgi:hypothetical protein
MTVPNDPLGHRLPRTPAHPTRILHYTPFGVLRNCPETPYSIAVCGAGVPELAGNPETCVARVLTKIKLYVILLKHDIDILK